MHAASDIARQTARTEAEIRADLAAAYRLVALFGWDDLIFTHISARIPGPEHHFLMNPYGLLFHEITASSLVKIDLDGNIVEPTSHKVNAAGFTIHSAVHVAREDVECVIHLHTIPGTAVSCLESGLAPIHQSAMLLNGQLTYHDYEGVALNHDERPRLVTDLGESNVMILRNHGTLTTGRSVAEAFTYMYFLERSCAIQVAAQSCGKVGHPATDVQSVVQDQGKSLGGAAAERLVWPALLRLADERSPGFRN